MLPWINATALDLRRAFIAAYLASDDSIADLARSFRVSRKTAHKVHQPLGANRRRRTRRPPHAH